MGVTEIPPLTKQEIKRNENDAKRKSCGEDGKGTDLIKEAGEIAV